MSWVLQYLVGFQQLGHDVYFVEKSGYPDSCYDPMKNQMSDDCTYGVRQVGHLLKRFGLGGKWCYVDAQERYYGLSKGQVEAVFESAELFIEMGTHEAWLTESSSARLRVLVDGDPGFTQIKLEKRLTRGEQVPLYDRYYSVGRNIGTEKSGAPTAGTEWHPLFHPVAIDLFTPTICLTCAPFTTIMNWQSYENVEYGGRVYGQKDIELNRFLTLPRHTMVPLAVAAAGGVPRELLSNYGWRVHDAHAVTISFDSFVRYIRDSRGEFSVAKNGYVATTSGWFSDRSAAYLASGRPVVMQDTGFSSHLPCGRGLFAVTTVDEAAWAIEEIHRDYDHHSSWAREIAIQYLDARKVLGGLLDELDVR
ncbi:MAG: hypothetical protein HYY30_00885 [Chloroflexi bacterium]|nr:hypothetical protein [Chloroflexota bacterium]